MLSTWCLRIRLIFVLVNLSLISTGCVAMEQSSDTNIDSASSPRTVFLRTPEWQGIDRISLICRINGTYGNELDQNTDLNLKHLEQDTRNLVCNMSLRILTKHLGRQFPIQIKQRPDSELLIPNHASMLFDIVMEWRKTPFKGIAIVISPKLFRHNPSGPPGKFFQAQPDFLLIATPQPQPQPQPQSVFSAENISELETLLDKQIVNILR